MSFIKKIILLMIYMSLFEYAFAQQKIGNLIIQVPSGYSFSWYDGDNEKYYDLNIGKYHKSINVVIFKINGKSEVEYNPKTTDVPNIKKYISGQTSVKPFAWPYHYRRIYLEKLNMHVIDCITLHEFELENIQFKRNIIFLDKDYCYNVTVIYEDAKDKIQNDLVEYFEIGDYDKNSLKWKDDMLITLYGKFKSYEALPKCLNELINMSDIIINNMIIKE